MILGNAELRAYVMMIGICLQNAMEECCSFFTFLPRSNLISLKTVFNHELVLVLRPKFEDLYNIWSKST